MKSNRKQKLKVEITCEVEKDGSLGQKYVTSGAGHRSGYCLRDPFSMLVDVDAIIEKVFIKSGSRKSANAE